MGTDRNGYYPENFSLYVASEMYLQQKGKQIAYGKVIINNLIIMENVRLMQGENSTFFVVPQYQIKEGKYKNYVSFPNEETYQRIHEQVFWNTAYLLDAKEYQPIEVEITARYKNRGRLLGCAAVTVIGVTIHGIRIWKTKEKTAGEKCEEDLQISMPQYRGKDVVHPANKEFRVRLQEAVIKEYLSCKSSGK